MNLRMIPVCARQEHAADYMGFILGARGGYGREAMPWKRGCARAKNRGTSTANYLYFT